MNRPSLLPECFPGHFSPTSSLLLNFRSKSLSLLFGRPISMIRILKVMINFALIAIKIQIHHLIAVRMAKVRTRDR